MRNKVNCVPCRVVALMKSSNMAVVCLCELLMNNMSSANLRSEKFASRSFSIRLGTAIVSVPLSTMVS